LSNIPYDFSNCGDPTRRHDFVFVFDVKLGNPNGDPDADNMPRQDQETNHGLVTDVCLKRKVRDFVLLTKQHEDGYDIFIKEHFLLNPQIEEAHKAVGNDVSAKSVRDSNKKRGQKGKAEGKEIELAQKWMCEKKYDIRMFGAVLSTGPNAGQVRGPVQMTFAQSVDPITPMENLISRVTKTDEKENTSTKEEETESEDNSEGQVSKSGTFGRKPIVPYALYVGYGFYSAPLGTKTKVTRADLELFWTALMQMWDHDRSASRGLMACRGLYVFSHADHLGTYPAHVLFDRFEAKLREGSETPRRFEDYVTLLNDHDLPEGVTLTKLVG